jgi:hypothetical protein
MEKPVHPVSPMVSLLLCEQQVASSILVAIYFVLIFHFYVIFVLISDLLSPLDISNNYIYDIFHSLFSNFLSHVFVPRETRHEIEWQIKVI